MKWLERKKAEDNRSLGLVWGSSWWPVEVGKAGWGSDGTPMV